MPAIVTCGGTKLENRWNVAADDLFLPAFISVVVGLFNFALISGVLLALYYIPSPIDSIFPPCYNLTYPPLLYAPLFSLDLIEVAFIFNESLFIVFAAHGPIFKDTPSSRRRRRVVPFLLYIRGFIAFLEVIAIVASLVGVYHPSVASLQDICEELIPRLDLAEAVLWLQVLLFLLFLLKVCICTDPLGISTPGLLEKIKMLDNSDNRGSLLEQSAEHTPGMDQLFQPDNMGSIMVANEVNIWRKHRPTIFRLNEQDLDRVTQVHNDNLDRKNYERRLKAIFCCLGVKGHKSRGVALGDVAKGLYTVFSDTDVVLSDVIAGFALLRNHQRKKRKQGGGSELAITKKFRIVTFKMMPLNQRFGFDPNIIREGSAFDLSNTGNQLLLLDLIHYMHYAMGIYGWPLHVFDNLGCGFCELCSVSCCRFRCMHRRVKNYEFLNDNFCMCGVGTFRLQTGLREEDIIYVNFENKIYLAPFIVCLDHRMKAVVVCVRGTLSFKDALTDMSFSPIHKKVSGIKETYIHGGMYRAALGILNTLRKKQLLTKAFKDHAGYQLVVTGHSLGAGVASILALLLKQELKYSDDLIKCYAFSPPGSLFSFPLAEYSKSFITTVVLGNDIVPRLTLRGLLFLKLGIEAQLRECEIPKYRILLCKKRRRCSNLFSCCRRRRKEVEDEEKPTTQGTYRAKREDLPPISPVEETIQEEGEDSVDGDSHLDKMGESIREDDSLEWQVLNKSTTTASIRKKLFQRSISIHPDKLPGYSRGFSRQRTSVNYQSQQSMATTAFAAKLRKAVSLDVNFDGEVFPEGVIQGTDEEGFPEFNEEVGPSFQETTFSSPTEHSKSATYTHTHEDPTSTHSGSGKADTSLSTPESGLTSDIPSDSNLTSSMSDDFKHKADSTTSPMHTSVTSENSQYHSTSPEIPTSSVQESNHPNASSDPILSSSSSKPSVLRSDRSITTPISFEATTPEFTNPQPFPPRPQILLTADARILNAVQTGESLNLSEQKKIREANQIPLTTAHIVKTKEEQATAEEETRERTVSDATPGGVLDNAVPQLLQHCKPADERKLFMPFFMPGRVLHLQVKKSKSWCGKDRLEMTEAYRENLCVILVDNGMVDDHLPNNVLSALKAYKSESGITFNYEEIDRERERQATLRTRIRRVSRSMNEVDGFIFVAGSPTSDSTSFSDASRRRTNFRKQQSFDKSMDVHPPLAGRNSLNIVDRSSAGLRRISECTDEEPSPGRVLPEAEVITTAKQTQGSKSSDTIGISDTKVNYTTENRGKIEEDNVDGQASSRGSSQARTGISGMSTGASGSGPLPPSSSKLSLLERRKFPSGGLKLNISEDNNTSMNAWISGEYML